MSDKQSYFELYRQSPLYQLLVALLIIVGVGFTLSVILIMAGQFIFGSDLKVLEKSAAALNSNDFAFLRYLLIIQDFSLLMIPSMIILFMLKPPHEGRLTEFKIPSLRDAGLVVILAFCLFPITSFTGQINSAMHLPDWLSGVEHWMAQKEEQTDNLIDSLLISKTLHVVILNLFTIALMPAIAEEMIFRGVLQKILSNLFRSGHLAIWFTAILFSTIHFQFFGFIPRFILGLVYGYLFFRSGTLWLPVISHFINNAVPVVLAYLQGMDKFNAPTDIPLWKQAVELPLPLVIILVILFYFRNKSQSSESSEINQRQIS